MSSLRRVFSDLKKKKALPPLVYYPRNQVQDDLDEKEVWRELRTPHGQPDNRIEWLEESVRRGEEELKDLKEGSEAYREAQLHIWRIRKQLRADAQKIRKEWQREVDKTQFWRKPKYAEDPRFKPLLTLIHSIEDRESLRRADAQSRLDGAARWLRGQRDASNAWLDERPESPTSMLSNLSLSDGESHVIASRPYPTRTSSLLAPPSPAPWGDRPMSRGRSLNTVPQVRSSPLERNVLKRRSNSVDGAEDLKLERSPSRLDKVLGRRRSKSRPRRVEGSERMVLD